MYLQSGDLTPRVSEQDEHQFLDDKHEIQSGIHEEQRGIREVQHGIHLTDTDDSAPPEEVSFYLCLR